MVTGEYRGQEIIAQLEARIMPPNHNYPDCECELVLTKQHLYVLEDNFDGTYETHFDFVLSEIDDIAVEKWTDKRNSGSTTDSVSNYVVSAILGLIGGMLITPSIKQDTVTQKKYLVIHYHTEQGKKESIYFNRYSSGVAGFLKRFHKLQTLYTA